MTTRGICWAAPPSRVSGDHVAATFTELINRYGPPASTLTDNGAVYTARFTGGHNRFGTPAGDPGHHPEERRTSTPANPGQDRTFPPNPQTLARRTPGTVIELQCQLDEFTHYYDEQRPHRATNRTTLPTPTTPSRRRYPPAHCQVRTACVTTKSTAPDTSASAAQAACTTSVSAAHTTTPVLLLIDPAEVTVISIDTQTVLSTTPSTPTADTGAAKARARPMAGSFLTCRSCRDSSVAHVPTHHTVETRGIRP